VHTAYAVLTRELHGC